MQQRQVITQHTLAEHAWSCQAHLRPPPPPPSTSLECDRIRPLSTPLEEVNVTGCQLQVVSRLHVVNPQPLTLILTLDPIPTLDPNGGESGCTVKGTDMQ